MDAGSRFPMNQNPFSFLRAGLVPLLMAATALMCLAAQPESTLPSDSNFREHPEWNKDCVDNLASMQGQRCDLIFIGDSITSMWSGGGPGRAVWDRYYSRRHALNFGAGGDRTQNVLFRLENWKVQDFKPKVAIILIGTNNIGDPVEEIAAGVKAVIAKTEQLYPSACIILVSVFPRAGHAPKVEQLNALIRSYADGDKVAYLDVASKFTPLGDTWKGLGPDRLHLAPEGYALWAEMMEPLLTRILGE
jgi:lysophospholipase L1-like esterase